MPGSGRVRRVAAHGIGLRAPSAACRQGPVLSQAATTPLASTEWAECLIPLVPVPAALETEVFGLLGAKPGWLPRIGRSPWIARALASFASHPVAYVTPALRDFVPFVVSQDNSCRYCHGVQRSLLKIFGYSDAYITRVERDFHVVDLAPAETAALDFVRKSSHANPRPTRSDLDELLRAGLSRGAVTEIAALAAASSFANRLATFLALPPEVRLESLTGRRFFGLLRPLIARSIRRHRRATAPARPSTEGPYARLVAALDGSPMAAVFRRIIDDAFGSPVLPARTKALMAAVIARALGCGYCEDEARRMLEQHGLGAAEIDRILTDLSSPRLDARESRLVGFARETVRYQPGAIQLRVRDVCQGFSADEAVEVVATAALANALGRLSIVLEMC